MDTYNAKDLVEFLTHGMIMYENYQPIMIKTLLEHYPNPTSRSKMVEVFIKHNPKKQNDFRKTVLEVAKTVLGPKNHNIVKYDKDRQELSLNLILEEPEIPILINRCNEKITEFEKITFVSDFFIAVGPWRNWEYSLSKTPLKWGVKDDKQDSNLKVFKKLSLNSIVFFYVNQDNPTIFSKRGLFGIGKVTRIYDDTTLFWPDEVDSQQVIYPHRFEIEQIKSVKTDSELIPWIKGLPFTKGLNHIVKQTHLRKLLDVVEKKWQIKLQQKFDLPFTLNEYYDKDQIRETLHLGKYGGIRIGTSHNIIVLFSNAPEKGKDDNFSNIYHDRFEEKDNLYYYTGEGRAGDQSLTRGNKALNNSENDGKTVYLFKQYQQGHAHEFLGPVRVVKYHTETQNDARKNPRTAYVFHLQLLSDPITNVEDAENREVESEQRKLRKTKKTKEELMVRLDFLTNLAETKGPRKGKIIAKQERETVKRRTEIVATMKEIYFEECQVCGTKHFEKDDGVYSEVHHLIPWSENHDDSKFNLVVVCANCHRKFEHAKNEIKRQIFKQLQKRFPEIPFKAPSYMYDLESN